MINMFLKYFFFIPKFFPYFRYENQLRPYFGIPKRNYGGPSLRTIQMIKFFGNFYFSPNIIYAQSWWTDKELLDCIEYSKKHLIPIVFNQNGWFYPGWYTGDWKKRNKIIVKVQKISKKVIYQSNFCIKESVYLNKYKKKNYKILYNPPLIKKLKKNKNYKKNFNILLTGVFGKESKHILLPALKAINYIHDKKISSNLKLNICGVFKKDAKNSNWYIQFKKISEKLKSKNLLSISGKYKHEELNKLLEITNLALHLKYKDPCPNAVIEKLIYGIPHVYSNSGGTGELIGNAGIGIKVKNSWNKMEETNYKILARKIIYLQVNESKFRRKAFKQSKKFNEKKYMQFHKKLFKKLIG